jgi:CDP-paratose 2-epimerase
MKVLITGICGFVGSALARRIKEAIPGTQVLGIDNLMRPGSEMNRRLNQTGIGVFYGDIRNASDIEGLPSADWVIDAAANPSVLAGLESGARQVVEHNLVGTINVLDYCRRNHSGLVLLSTSRVYSIEALSQLPMEVVGSRFVPKFAKIRTLGVSNLGISEGFSTAAPISIYGATKLASEALALEYGKAFDFPVWINRCGVLAGAGQFGTAEQGVFSYWVHAWRAGKPLRYIGFGGHGCQVRDALHPDDLAALVLEQIRYSGSDRERIYNVAGGAANSISLRELSDWCKQRFGPISVSSEPRERSFDIPWLVLDRTKAASTWNWRCQRSLESILEEIAEHAERHPDWLELTSA